MASTDAANHRPTATPSTIRLFALLISQNHFISPCMGADRFHDVRRERRNMRSTMPRSLAKVSTKSRTATSDANERAPRAPRLAPDAARADATDPSPARVRSGPPPELTPSESLRSDRQ